MPHTTVQVSEAELHFLRARLQGGIISRASRGEIKVPLPVGPVHDPLGRFVLDPDARVRKGIAFLFSTLARTGETRQPK